MSLLANAGPYDLTKTWYVDGTATDVGTVTVGIVDGNGDEVVASGTSTTNNADGTYTYALADQTEPNMLTVTWTRSDANGDLSDELEVVGGRLFTEAAFRAHNDDLFSSEARYPDATIAAARDAVTELLEQWTGQSWIRRYVRLELRGTGAYDLGLSDGIARTSAGKHLSRPGRLRHIDTILSASVSGSSITASNVVAERGVLWRTDGTWSTGTTSNPFNVKLEYVYGHAYTTDNVDRIAMLLTADRLRETVMSDRTTSFSDELGTYRYETPGRWGNVSAIPEVNEWVKSHRDPVSVV